MADEPEYLKLYDQLQAVADSLPAPIFVIDYDGRYVSVFGGQSRNQYDAGENLVGCYMQDVLPKEKWQLFLGVIRKAIDSGTLQTCDYQLASSDVSVTQNDGPEGIQWFHGQVYPVKVRGEGTPTAVWLALNVSEQKSLEMRLQQLSEHDDLTGIYNRRYFMNRLDNEFQIAGRRRQKLSLICIDIDHFKSINDRFGHLIGDKALQHLASTIQGQLRGEDIFARMGGEEFGIICISTELADAFHLAERIRRIVEEKELKIENGFLKLTISLGLAEFTPADGNAHTLLSRADKFLYIAKESGRNRTCSRFTDP